MHALAGSRHIGMEALATGHGKEEQKFLKLRKYFEDDVIVLIEKDMLWFWLGITISSAGH